MPMACVGDRSIENDKALPWRAQFLAPGLAVEQICAIDAAALHSLGDALLPE